MPVARAASVPQKVFIFHNGEAAFIPPTCVNGGLLYDLVLFSAFEAMGYARDAVNVRRLIVDWKLILPTITSANGMHMPSELTRRALGVC